MAREPLSKGILGVENSKHIVALLMMEGVLLLKMVFFPRVFGVPRKKITANDYFFP